MNHHPVEDVIRVRDLLLTVFFTDGAHWPSAKHVLQPVHITIDVSHDITQTAETENISHSVNYSTVCKCAIEACNNKTFPSLEALSDTISEACFAAHPEVQKLSVHIKRPRALLYPAATNISTSKTRDGRRDLLEHMSITDLECHPIIGINQCERETRQLVRFDVSWFRRRQRVTPFGYRELAQKIFDSVTASAYLTLEALVSSVARISLEDAGEPIDSVTVRAVKPNAVVCAEAAEVEISRVLVNGALLCPSAGQGTPALVSSTDAPAPCIPSGTAEKLGASEAPSELSSAGRAHHTAIALGSNLGDRFANIELALRLLEQPGDQHDLPAAKAYATVIDTSFMYETEPMYVTDQPKFINCACLVETNIAPVNMLKFLKEIETAVGRVASFRNGPRAIDLDILTYDSETIDTRPADEKTLENLEGQLVVPHPRMLEREFVLRPLNDIMPEYICPGASGHRIRDLLSALLQSSGPSDMNRVVPFPRYPFSPPSSDLEVAPVPLTAAYWSFPVALSAASSYHPHKTYIMATLNATPDSFSDGSVHNTVPAALKYAMAAVAAGADIIDIGGYSTRPGAVYVSPEEEISRVVPVITAIRGLGEHDPEGSLERRTSRVLISVDTFRWEVAEAAIKAGANCINDVYAFTGPAYPLDKAGQGHFLDMRRVARDLAVPVILMHSRGEASENKDYSAYDYAADRTGRGVVIEGVRVELGHKVNAAVKGKGGLRRWYVIVDPGIGFSKSVAGNIEVLRSAASITNHEPSGQLGISNPLAGYPLLIGTSKKSFLGKLLKQPDRDGGYPGRETEANERNWATAAAVACAVQQNAAVVRVHDVLEMGDVVRITSALMS